MFIKTTMCLAEAAATGGTPGFGFQHHDGPDEFEVDISAPKVDYDNSEDYDNRNITDDEDSEATETSTESSSDVADASKVASLPAEFKPYSFKGKVNGEDVAQEFKSQKDLDRTIANGLIAPKIHAAYTSLQKEVGGLREAAEWANGLVSLAKESPAEFFTHVVETMIPEEALMDFVFNKNQHYTKLANMTPEDRKRHNTNIAAEKILRDQAHAAEMAAEAREQQQKALAAQEKAEFANWKTKEVSYWRSRLPESVQDKVEDYIRYVAAYAEKQLDRNPDYSYPDMSKELAKLLSPLKTTTQSSSSKKKEELANNQGRAQSETEKLRAMSNQNSGAKQPVKTTADAFKNLRREVLAGINKR